MLEWHILQYFYTIAQTKFLNGLVELSDIVSAPADDDKLYVRYIFQCFDDKVYVFSFLDGADIQYESVVQLIQGLDLCVQFLCGRYGENGRAALVHDVDFFRCDVIKSYDIFLRALADSYNFVCRQACFPEFVGINETVQSMIILWETLKYQVMYGYDSLYAWIF